jgi:hypothetical protein
MWIICSSPVHILVLNPQKLTCVLNNKIQEIYSFQITYKYSPATKVENVRKILLDKKSCKKSVIIQKIISRAWNKLTAGECMNENFTDVNSLEWPLFQPLKTSVNLLKACLLKNSFIYWLGQLWYFIKSLLWMLWLGEG